MEHSSFAKVTEDKGHNGIMKFSGFTITRTDCLRKDTETAKGVEPKALGRAYMKKTKIIYYIAGC